MRYQALAMILVIFVYGCTERYDIELDDSFTKLVVDGQITTDTLSHTISLTTSSAYFSNQEPPVVSGAEVFLDDGHEKIKLVETPHGSGIYATPPHYYGIPGRTYTLEINLNEQIGGTSYYTAKSTMPHSAFSLDDIELELQERFDYWIVKLFAYDPPTTDFYKFDIEVNGTSFTDTAYRAMVIDDVLFNGKIIKGMGVLFLRRDEIKPGDTIKFMMSAIPRDYYNFFNELRSESGGFSNPLFSGPPANIRSNIEEDGLGFFVAYKSKSIHHIVSDSLFLTLKHGNK